MGRIVKMDAVKGMDGVSSRAGRSWISRGMVDGAERVCLLCVVARDFTEWVQETQECDGTRRGDKRRKASLTTVVESFYASCLGNFDIADQNAEWCLSDNAATPKEEICEDGGPVETEILPLECGV